MATILRRILLSKGRDTTGEALVKEPNSLDNSPIINEEGQQARIKEVHSPFELRIQGLRHEYLQGTLRDLNSCYGLFPF
jgi:hypothetical protein